MDLAHKGAYKALYDPALLLLAQFPEAQCHPILRTAALQRLAMKFACIVDEHSLWQAFHVPWCCHIESSESFCLASGDACNT
ncbi:hypothetical protein XFF7766_280085 [Xanthomonas citri pv. fuscans]|nr:hypothetical protein XFF7766_280085 [Xanthomonas citri pv. fuscans]